MTTDTDDQLGDEWVTVVRQEMTKQFNENPRTKEELAKEYEGVWDMEELRKEFDVSGFLAPFVSVTRKSDGVKGTMMFQHDPRYYFDWTAE